MECWYRKFSKAQYPFSMSLTYTNNLRCVAGKTSPARLQLECAQKSPGILLKCVFSFNRSKVGTKFSLSNKLPVVVDAAGLTTTV